jgi:hypothetical protein
MYLESNIVLKAEKFLFLLTTFSFTLLLKIRHLWTTSAAAVPLIIVHLSMPVYMRGFYCDDVSIRYQYQYRDSSISTGLLIAFNTLIPTALGPEHT